MRICIGIGRPHGIIVLGQSDVTEGDTALRNQHHLVQLAHHWLSMSNLACCLEALIDDEMACTAEAEEHIPVGVKSMSNDWRLRPPKRRRRSCGQCR
jgi:hypothetical protein